MSIDASALALRPPAAAGDGAGAPAQDGRAQDGRAQQRRTGSPKSRRTESTRQWWWTAPGARRVPAFLRREYAELQTVAAEDRAFLLRAVHFLTGQGITQFLVVGTGTSDSSTLRRIAPVGRVAHVEVSPIPAGPVRGVLGTASTRACGRLARLDLDTLAHSAQAQLLDLDQPVAVLLVGLLHLVPDDRDPYGAVYRLLTRLAPGSCLGISHLADDCGPDGLASAGLEAAMAFYQRAGIPVRLRTAAEIRGFFQTLDLVEPGIVPISRWRRACPADPEYAAGYAAIGRLTP